MVYWKLKYVINQKNPRSKLLLDPSEDNLRRIAREFVKQNPEYNLLERAEGFAIVTSDGKKQLRNEILLSSLKLEPYTILFRDHGEISLSIDEMIHIGKKITEELNEFLLFDKVDAYIFSDLNDNEE